MRTVDVDTSEKYLCILLFVVIELLKCEYSLNTGFVIELSGSNNFIDKQASACGPVNDPSKEPGNLIRNFKIYCIKLLASVKQFAILLTRFRSLYTLVLLAVEVRGLTERSSQQLAGILQTLLQSQRVLSFVVEPIVWMFSPRNRKVEYIFDLLLSHQAQSAGSSIGFSGRELRS